MLVVKLAFIAAIILAGAAQASANCYVLQNNTDSVQTWHFQYTKPMPGAATVIQMQPHSTYPTHAAAHGWCWNVSPTYSATVTIDPGNYQPSWSGPLVLGNGKSVAPSGTYSLQPAKRAAP